MDADGCLTGKQIEVLEDTFLQCRKLAQCYQDAALSTTNRACGNLLTELAERFEALAADLQQERDRAQGRAVPQGPLPMPRHLFAWHLAEDDDEPSEGLSPVIRDAEQRLRRDLHRLRAAGPLPGAAWSVVDRALAAMRKDGARAGLGRCLDDADEARSSPRWSAGPAPAAPGATFGRR